MIPLSCAHCTSVFYIIRNLFQPSLYSKVLFRNQQHSCPTQKLNYYIQNFSEKFTFITNAVITLRDAKGRIKYFFINEISNIYNHFFTYRCRKPRSSFRSFHQKFGTRNSKFGTDSRSLDTPGRPRGVHPGLWVHGIQWRIKSKSNRTEPNLT